MIRIRFVDAAEALLAEAEAVPGDRLLDVAQAAGMPLEGTCEGQMACSTCHVILPPDDFVRFPRASEEEEDMLDLAAAVTRYSRLSCQLRLDEAMDRITVRIPSEAHDMQGR